MKKSFCIIFATLLAVTSFAACNKKDTVDENATTYTNSDGSAYVEVTDKNGEAVTDKNGETVTSVLSQKEASKLEKDKSKASGKTDKSSTTKSGGKQTTTGLAGLEDLANSDMQITAAPENTLPEGTTVKKTEKKTLRETVIEKVIKTQKFTLKTDIVSGDQKIPATIAFNGNDLCMDITYSNWNMRLVSVDGKMYLVFPALKMYAASGDSEDMLGNFSDLSADQNYVKTTKVDNYTCEEYSSEGATIKYYFDKHDNWKRWESIDEDGIATVFEVSEFSGKVDSSLFSLKGYTQLSDDALSKAFS